MTALHGFLGQPGDWDGILAPEWRKPNWLRGLADGEDLLVRLAKQLNDENPTSDTLLGYSMGGRIALHMLLQAPSRWRQAVIVSASPGLGPSEDREGRELRDAQWAERFLHDDWNQVVGDWNRQSVFAHDPQDRLPRLENAYDRESLAIALVQGSVARQRDLRPQLTDLAVPILWIAGGRDTKYAELARECAALRPNFSFAILPDAGHRAPWGNPTAFRSALEAFFTINP